MQPGFCFYYGSSVDLYEYVFSWKWYQGVYEVPKFVKSGCIMNLSGLMDMQQSWGMAALTQDNQTQLVCKQELSLYSQPSQI